MQGGKWYLYSQCYAMTHKMRANADFVGNDFLAWDFLPIVAFLEKDFPYLAFHQLAATDVPAGVALKYLVESAKTLLQ